MAASTVFVIQTQTKLELNGTSQESKDYTATATRPAQVAIFSQWVSGTAIDGSFEYSQDPADAAHWASSALAMAAAAAADAVTPINAGIVLIHSKILGLL